MNDRRRVRLFLDHKPPLVAFTVVSIACALMMVHVARSEAAPGWLRAGLSGVVAQRIAEATVLEPDPAPERRTEAAAPLTGGPRDPGTGPEHADGGQPSAPVGGAAGGAEVGVVHPGPGEHAGAPQPAADAPGEAVEVGDDTTGPGHGRGAGRAPLAPFDVPVPGAASGRGPGHPNDWRDEWVGDRGRGKGPGHDGDRRPGPKSSAPGQSHGHGHSPSEHGSGEHGSGKHGHGKHGHGKHGHGPGKGHGNDGRDRGEHGRGGSKHGSVHGYTHH